MKWAPDTFPFQWLLSVDLLTTNLFIHNKSVENLIKNAGTCVTVLKNWFIVYKLSLSIDNTCYSVFSASASDRNGIKLNIADVELKQVEST